MKYYLEDSKVILTNRIKVILDEVAAILSMKNDYVYASQQVGFQATIETLLEDIEENGFENAVGFLHTVFGNIGQNRMKAMINAKDLETYNNISFILFTNIKMYAALMREVEALIKEHS